MSRGVPRHTSIVNVRDKAVKPKRIAVAALLCLAPLAPALADGRTIVGEWAQSPGDCGTQFAYRIGPRSIVTDEMSCTFGSVSRNGGTVRFTGLCEPDARDGAETVVATRSGERLRLSFLRGGGGGDLVRCPRAAEAGTAR